MASPLPTAASRPAPSAPKPPHGSRLSPLRVALGALCCPQTSQGLLYRGPLCWGLLYWGHPPTDIASRAPVLPSCSAPGPQGQPLLGTPPKLRAPPGPVPPATVGMALPWLVPSLCCQHHRDHVGAPLPCTPVQQCWGRCPTTTTPIPPICLMQSPCTRLGVPLPRPGSTPFPHPSAHGSGPPPVLPAFKDPSPFPEIL